MKTGYSLPHSKELVISCYPQWEQSSSWPYTTSWKLILILSSHLRILVHLLIFSLTVYHNASYKTYKTHLRLVLQNVLFPSRLYTKNLHASLSPHTCYILLKLNVNKSYKPSVLLTLCRIPFSKVLRKFHELFFTFPWRIVKKKNIKEKWNKLLLNIRKTFSLAHTSDYREYIYSCRTSPSRPKNNTI